MHCPDDLIRQAILVLGQYSDIEKYLVFVKHLQAILGYCQSWQKELDSVKKNIIFQFYNNRRPTEILGHLPKCKAEAKIHKLSVTDF